MDCLQTVSHLKGSQTRPDDDGMKETPSKNKNDNNNNNGVNRIPSKNDNNGVNKTPSNVEREGKYAREKASMLGGQIISVAAIVWAKSSSTKMSREAICLGYFLSACVIVSLISFSYGLFLSLHERLRKVAQVMRAIGIVATLFAFVTAIGLHLLDQPYGAV